MGSHTSTSLLPIDVLSMGHKSQLHIQAPPLLLPLPFRITKCFAWYCCSLWRSYQNTHPWLLFSHLQLAPTPQGHGNFIQWWFCFVALICVMAFNFYPPASYWYRYILTFIYSTLNPDKPGTMWCPPLRYWFKSWQYFWCSITQKNLLQSYQKKTYFKSLWSLYNMMVLSKSSKLNLCFHLRAHLLKSVKKID